MLTTNRVSEGVQGPCQNHRDVDFRKNLVETGGPMRSNEFQVADIRCSRCGHNKANGHIVSSYDEAYDDVRYTCQFCYYVWNVEGVAA